MLLLLAGCVGSEGPDPGDRRPHDTGTFDPGLPVAVTVAARPACPEPAARDVRPFDALVLPAEPVKPAWFWGVGIVVADLTGDDRLDVVLPGFWGTALHVGLPGGGFEDQTGLLPGLFAGAAGGAAADYDGDGDLDLLITRFQAPNALLRNDGGVFVDATEAAGLPQDARRSVSASWADYDRDGDLDVFVGCYGFVDETDGDPDHVEFTPADPDWLLLNDGDGTFTDRSDLLPPEVHDGYALAGGWHDLDRDGWLDLYAVNDFGQSYPNHLMWNREGTLVEDDGAHGLDVGITGMGAAVGDLNGDGLDDVVMTAWEGNSTMVSGAGGLGWFESVDLVGPWVDVAAGQKIAWGVDLADLDLDGDLDAPMTYGWLDSRYESPLEQPDALYLWEDDRFVDRAGAWGVDQGTVGRGFVAADVNDDGWLDLLRRDLAGPTLYDRSRCGAGTWLRVRLRQPGANRFAIGARVVATAGDRTWHRVVLAGGTNLASSGPPEVHLGLGGAERVDRLEVVWPDGEVSRLRDVDAGAVLVVERS